MVVNGWGMLVIMDMGMVVMGVMMGVIIVIRDIHGRIDGLADGEGNDQSFALLTSTYIVDDERSVVSKRIHRVLASHPITQRESIS